MTDQARGDFHGRRHARADRDPRRGHQPALQLGARAAGARHHGRRFRGARRLPAAAPLSPRPRPAGAGEVEPRRAAGVRRQQHPLPHLDQDRRMGARQALPLGAAAAQGRPDPVGLRLGRRAPQALHALAQAGELQGRPDRPARHRQPRLRADEAPCRGDRLAHPRGRRRQHAGRHRYRRAADAVRAGEGRTQDRRRPADHAGGARDQVGRRDRAAQPLRRHGRRRLSPDP